MFLFHQFEKLFLKNFFLFVCLTGSQAEINKVYEKNTFGVFRQRSRLFVPDYPTLLIMHAILRESLQ